jgi:hypothetical protein
MRSSSRNNCHQAEPPASPAAQAWRSAPAARRARTTPCRS